MNNRRKIVITLGAGGAALALPLNSLAQAPGKTWRVGFLTARNRPISLDSDIFGAFRYGMRELGYVEGKNLVIEWRFADLNDERLKSFAEELVRLKVDLIVAGNTTAALAAQEATITLPIIMSSSGDPVGSGLAKALARPGGNITGLSNLSPEIGAKLLEMLLAMSPGLARVAVMVNPANTGNQLVLKNLQAAARNTKTRIFPFEVRGAQDIEAAFSGIIRERCEAVILPRDSVFGQHGNRIVERATQLRMLSASGDREIAESGGLLAYAPNRTDAYRRVAFYADRIFKGAAPSDLPIEQPTQFELVINGKTAKTLGLKIPQALRVSADKVIE